MLKLVNTIKTAMSISKNNIAEHADTILLTKPDFHRALNVERERSDRSGLPFSILVFELKDSEISVEDLNIFEEFLARRLRATDSVGWLDRNHVGITMFNTASDGAGVLASEIRNEFHKNHRPPMEAKVYIYPDEAKNITAYSKNFQKTLQLERERADRSGLPFSILMFEVDKSNGKNHDINLIKDFLSSRLRTTDSIGWVDEGNMGVTMFNTNSDGARVLAREILDVFKKEDRSLPKIKILLYQDDELKISNYGSDATHVEKIHFEVASSNRKETVEHHGPFQDYE